MIATFIIIIIIITVLWELQCSLFNIRIRISIPLLSHNREICLPHKNIHIYTYENNIVQNLHVIINSVAVNCLFMDNKYGYYKIDQIVQTKSEKWVKYSCISQCTVKKKSRVRSARSSAGCTVWLQQEGRTCDTSPSHTWGASACCWRSCPVLWKWPAGWDSCTSSSITLLSPTTCTGARGHPRMELAFLISLLSLHVSAAEVQSALTCLICCCSVIRPVQFIAQVNSQVLARCHNLNVRSLDVLLFAGLSVPAEILHKLSGVAGVELEVVQLAAVYKVLNELSVGSAVPVPDEAIDSRFVREF